MRNKNIKSKDFLSCLNGKTLFGLLCILFSPLVSAQVFQSGGTLIYVGKETTITRNLSESLPLTPSKGGGIIYIVKGTKVTGLKPTQDILITCIENPTIANTSWVKNFVQQKNVEKTTSEKKQKQKRTLPAEITIAPNSHSKTFLFVYNQSIGIVTTTIQLLKLFAIVLQTEKMAIVFSYYEKKATTTLFETNPIFFLTANSIRPPPCES